MSDFRKGDRVKFVDDYVNIAKRGDRGTVDRFKLDAQGAPMVYLSLDSGRRDGRTGRVGAFDWRLKKLEAPADTNGMDNFDRILERLDAAPELRSIDVTDQIGRRRAVVVKPHAFDELMRQAQIAPTPNTLKAATEAIRREYEAHDFQDFVGRRAIVPLKAAPKSALPNNSGHPSWLTTSEG